MVAFLRLRSSNNSKAYSLLTIRPDFLLTGERVGTSLDCGPRHDRIDEWLIHEKGQKLIQELVGIGLTASRVLP